MGKVLLVVDLQKEFKDSQGNYEKCLTYIKEHASEYDLVVGTYFKNESTDKDNKFVQELDYTGCRHASGNSIEYTASKLLLIKKYTYAFDRNNILYINDKIDIIGCGLDTCILATCFSLWDKGLNFNVLTDYCYTTNKQVDKDTIVSLLKRNFGKCIIYPSVR